MKINKNQGFTLIELMVVVAIVGVLASLAIPAYQDYMIKTRFAEVVSATDSVRTTMADCLQNNGAAIAACDSFTKLGITDPGNNPTLNIVSIKITPTTGVITATSSALAGGSSYAVTPIIAPGDVMFKFKVDAATSTCLTHVPPLCKLN